ncbi:MAG TPA: Lrp/AsnC family transcriptional regulator, partial [Thermoplasmata archaeon]|nr:Lrp/AsnC family transcriptional regulator [Thermoplasmata archaeon]
LAKTRFPDYAGMRDFILNDLSGIDGVKETKTMVVVRVFKE